MTKVTKGNDGRKAYSWIVEFKVSKTWIEDGFDLTPEDVRQMIKHQLPYAEGSEVSARIIDEPNPKLLENDFQYRWH